MNAGFQACGALLRARVAALPAVERMVVRLDAIANQLVHLAHVQGLFCWRFLLRAQKPAARPAAVTPADARG